MLGKVLMGVGLAALTAALVLGVATETVSKLLDLIIGLAGLISGVFGIAKTRA